MCNIGIEICCKHAHFSRMTWDVAPLCLRHYLAWASSAHTLFRTPTSTQYIRTRRRVAQHVKHTRCIVAHHELPLTEIVETWITKGVVHQCRSAVGAAESHRTSEKPLPSHLSHFSIWRPTQIRQVGARSIIIIIPVIERNPLVRAASDCRGANVFKTHYAAEWETASCTSNYTPKQMQAATTKRYLLPNRYYQPLDCVAYAQLIFNIPESAIWRGRAAAPLGLDAGKVCFGFVRSAKYKDTSRGYGIYWKMLLMRIWQKI